MKKNKEPAFSREEAEEFTQSMGQIVSGSYRQILLADKKGIPKALGYENLKDWVNDRMGGSVRYAAEERQRLAIELRAEGESYEKIATALGAGIGTIHADVNGRSTENLRNEGQSEASEAENLQNRKNDEPPADFPPDRPKTKQEIEWELQNAADDGLQSLIWEKIKDQVIPFWDHLNEMLDEHERPFLLQTLEHYLNEHETKQKYGHQ